MSGLNKTAPSRDTASTTVGTPFNNNHIVLQDFYRSCQELVAGRELTRFNCVYYPIAMLELELLENSSEEFDTIEKSILELFYSGVETAEQISEVMGLPFNYTQKLMGILEGYGHIDNGKLTELGKRSVAEGIKYTKYTTRQIVQADSIHGVLLSREFNQPHPALFQPDETTGNYQHILPDPFLTTEAFNRLMSETVKIRHAKKGIFHINIEQIQGILSQEMKYAYAFLVRLEGVPHPFVLLKHMSSSPETRSTAYTWKPVALSRSNADALGAAAAAYEIVEDTAIEPLLATSKTIAMQMLSSTRKPNFTAKWKETLQKQLGLNGEEVPYQMKQKQVILDLRMSSFTHVTKTTFQLLQQLSDPGALPYVGFARNDLLPGAIARAVTSDAQLQGLADRLRRLQIDNPQAYQKLQQEIISIQPYEQRWNELSERISKL